MALSELFEVSIDEMIFDRTKEIPTKEHSEQHLSMADVIDKKILSEKNGKSLKKVLKYVGIGLGFLLLVDVISMIIYFAFNGFPR